jgi:hypothetical protein
MINRIDPAPSTGRNEGCGIDKIKSNPVNPVQLFAKRARIASVRY